MRWRDQLSPTLLTLASAGLLIAAVYRDVPPWLGIAGVVGLFAGGIWALWRTGAERREWAQDFWNSSSGGVPPTLGGFSDGHHHGGHHHGGFDGGGLFDGGNPFDAGGFFDGGGGGDGGGGN
jgi:hypothetical protein